MRTIKNAVRFFNLSVGIILFGHAISTFGANHQVSTTSNFRFSPSTLTINAGDSVTWNGLEAGGHTVTSDTGLWPSSSSDGFTFTFTNAGTYNYHCIPHQSLGMVGSITVNAVAPPNQPPTISVTSPTSGAVFSAPANVTIQASAADSDGSVTNVKFLNGATLIGNVASAPFSITANNLAAADYTFSAIASDNNGATATNSVTVHVINPSPVNISASAISSPGHFQFSYSTDLGLSYVVQVSTNLLTWTNVATNSPAASNPAVFIDPNIGGGAFYRVGRLPNP